MLDTNSLSVTFRGDFGFLILRGSGAELQLCFCTTIASITVERHETSLEIHGQRKPGAPTPGTMMWQSLSSQLQLNTLTVDCSNTQIQFEHLRFNSTANLIIHGSSNVLVFSDCVIERLKLCSQQPNKLDFRAQTPLTELDAELHGSTMQACIWGSTWSSVRSLDGSNIFLYIESQNHSRTFDFTKDCKSQIFVKGSHEPQRMITADHEQWNIGLKLETIKLDTQQQLLDYSMDEPSEVPRGSPCCAVCKNAVPSYLLEPCTHFGLCSDCALSFQKHGLTSCPYCSEPIEHMKHIFITCS